jgi:hypothetical protein
MISFWFDLTKAQNLVPFVNVAYKYNTGLPNLVLLAYVDNSFLSGDDCASIQAKQNGLSLTTLNLPFGICLISGLTNSVDVFYYIN